jgi:hypothetical protein
MVERPIKKSERQADAPSSKSDRPTEERLDSTPRRAFQKTDRAKGRGKGNQEDSRPSNVNPALVRGKKPTKPKPPVLEETPEPTAEDAVTENSPETTAEPTTEDAVTENSPETTAVE